MDVTRVCSSARSMNLDPCESSSTWTTMRPSAIPATLVVRGVKLEPYFARAPLCGAGAGL